jgi:predicted DCC family thiol-disulfide oxidoreductase YuxK
MKPFCNDSGAGVASSSGAAETVGAAAAPLGGPKPGNVTVFYDGACPLCAAEIGYYQGRRGSETVKWVDVSACEAIEVISGLKREDALRRFHVRTSAGQVISGGRAFAVLWSALPGFRWLGQVFRSGIPARLLDWLYDRFLRWRPHFQALARRHPSRFQRGL